MTPKFRSTSIDITGQRFGKLVAIKFVEYTRNKQQKWLFRCECGEDTIILKSSVCKPGGTRSCGCLSKKHFKDLTGKTVNGNTFIRLVDKNRHNCWRYEIQCHCGKLFISEGNDVNSGKIKSCGCRWNSTWVENANYELSILNQAYTQLVGRAPKRKIACSLTKEQHHKLVLDNCYYCGVPPNQTKTLNKRKLLCHGIDRVDNDKGYHIDNCVTACRDCNQAKHTMKVEYFKEWIERMFMQKENNKGLWNE